MNEEIIREIKELKKRRNAVILAHNYQLPEIQDIADILGDSLELAIRAKEAREEVIVFCGVRFMAETAKILNPKKTVLIPEKDAGCPLADYLTPEMVIAARRDHPGAAVVLYVNSTAASKAEADITCTSANAVEVVRSLEATTILFGPDSNLADYVRSKVPEKTIIPLPPGGHCYVHELFTCDDIIEAADRGDVTICHPECPREVRNGSDLVASTGGMVRMAENAESWTLLTERDMAYRLRMLFPDREFHVKDEAICRDMKKTTLKSVLRALRTDTYEVVLPDEIMDRARVPIERMLAVR